MVRVGSVRVDCDGCLFLRSSVVGSEFALSQEVELIVDSVKEAGLGRQGQGSSADGLQHGYE